MNTRSVRRYVYLNCGLAAMYLALLAWIAAGTRPWM